MYTHCPHCDTCFRVVPEQLKAAQGSVRCGRCFGTFNALENLVNKETAEAKTSPAPAKPLPPKPKPAAPRKPSPAPAPKKVSTPAPPKTTATKPTVKSATQKPVAPRRPAKPVTPTRNPVAAIADTNHLIPEGIPSEPDGQSLFWLWMGLAIALGGVFAGQYAYFNVNSLSQTPSLRPALQIMCSIANCEVPLIKAPHLIAIVERDIRNHPDRKDVLQVKAKIINKAPFQQAYPRMGLSLHDITGHIIKERRFLPEEYLTKGISADEGMAPQQSVEILLELADPGKEAVGFEFEFF